MWVIRGFDHPADPPEAPYTRQPPMGFQRLLDIPSTTTQEPRATLRAESASIICRLTYIGQVTYSLGRLPKPGPTQQAIGYT